MSSRPSERPGSSSQVRSRRRWRNSSSAFAKMRRLFKVRKASMKAFVIAEHSNGQLKRVTLELIAELHRQGVTATVLLLGNGDLQAVTSELGRGGASKDLKITPLN